MKLFKSLFLFLAVAFASESAMAQDVLLNILTQNSGAVSKKETIFLEVTVCNTSATTAVPVYKLRPQISFPAALVSIPDSGHNLPAGWSILSNTAGVVWLSNGTDMIPPHDCRTILIAIKGRSVGGPSTISGNLMFSNGISPGSSPGGATPGDNPADNASTSTVRVIR